MKKIKLLFVDPVANHNKVYNMDQINDTQFVSAWGRVGNNLSSQTYSMSEWGKILRSKLNKGYKEVENTDLVKNISTVSTADNLKPNIRKLLEKLNKYAKEAIKLNYDIAPMDVSKVLVTNAQTIIDDINKQLQLNVSVPSINTLLLKLYNTIPRKMKNVRDQLVNVALDNDKELDKMHDKMTMEQALLDTMKGQIAASEANAGNDTTNASGQTSKVLTVLDQLGLDIEDVTKQEEDTLKQMMTDSSHRFIEAHKIVNYKTQKNFDAEIAKSTNKETKLLFHGSRSENWLNIIREGLVLRPNAHKVGTLFDEGIYFADEADKSLGYINGGRWINGSKIDDNWLAVYEVHMGKMMTFKQLGPLELNAKIDLAEYIPNNGYDSFYAEKNKKSISGKSKIRYTLSRNEYIIFNENKCTIKYLIQINA